MWLLWFQFSLHLATEKLDPWFGLWLGGEEEWSLDLIPAGKALSVPQRQHHWGLEEEERKPAPPKKPHSSSSLLVH